MTKETKKKLPPLVVGFLTHCFAPSNPYKVNTIKPTDLERFFLECDLPEHEMLELLDAKALSKFMGMMNAMDPEAFPPPKDMTTRMALCKALQFVQTNKHKYGPARAVSPTPAANTTSSSKSVAEKSPSTTASKSAAASTSVSYERMWVSSDEMMKRYRQGHPELEDDKTKDQNLEFYRGSMLMTPYKCSINDFHRPWEDPMLKSSDDDDDNDGTLKDEQPEGWFGNYWRLEREHGFIQWLFPLQEGQGLSSTSQRLYKHEIESMKNDATIMEKIKLSYKLMLDFYGMELTDQTTGAIARRPDPDFKGRYMNLNTSSHNYLRITRMMKCLGDLGLEVYKVAWLEFLIDEVCPAIDEDATKLPQLLLPNCSHSLREFWIETIRDDDVRKQLKDKATARASALSEAKTRVRQNAAATDFDDPAIVAAGVAPPAWPTEDEEDSAFAMMSEHFEAFNGGNNGGMSAEDRSHMAYYERLEGCDDATTTEPMAIPKPRSAQFVDPNAGVASSTATLPKEKHPSSATTEDTTTEEETGMPPAVRQYIMDYPNVKDKLHKNQNLDFYRGALTMESYGCYIDDFHPRHDATRTALANGDDDASDTAGVTADWQWFVNYDRLAMDDDYMYWLFPTQDKLDYDGAYCGAQRLYKHEIRWMKRDAAVLERVLRSYMLMLDYFGLELIDEESGEIGMTGRVHIMCQNDFAKVTRILKFLGEMELGHLQKGLLDHMIDDLHHNRELDIVREHLCKSWVLTLRDQDDRSIYITKAFTLFKLLLDDDDDDNYGAEDDDEDRYANSYGSDAEDELQVSGDDEEQQAESYHRGAYL